MGSTMQLPAKRFREEENHKNQHEMGINFPKFAEILAGGNLTILDSASLD